MSPVARFLFERSFDPIELAEPPTLLEPECAADATGAEGHQDEPVQPQFSEEDVDRARAEGHTEGRAAAAAEAAAVIAARTADALEAIVRRLEELARDRAADEDAKARDAAAVALAVVRKLWPGLARTTALAEIERVVATVMARLRADSKLAVQVNEDLCDLVAGRLGTIADRHGFAGALVVTGDASIAPGDCRVVWDGGGAVRDSERLWRLIDEAVGQRLGETPAADGAPNAPNDPGVIVERRREPMPASVDSEA